MTVIPRYRICYAKEGEASFVSHLDMIRVFERSIRRAGLPVAYSEGFNPHAKIFFGFPLPVGLAGLEEFMDIELAKSISVGAIASSLNNCIPLGFRIKGVCLLGDSSKSLMAQVESSCYLAELEIDKAADLKTFQLQLEELIKMPEIWVLRKRKKEKSVLFDIKPGILSLRAYEEDDRRFVRMDLMTNSSINVRPQEVLMAYCELFNMPDGIQILYVTRIKMLAGGGKELSYFCATPMVTDLV